MRDTSKAHAGQTIMQDSPVDKSSYGHKGPSEQPMKGGPSDLSHSLAGASAAKQDGNTGRKSTIKEA